MHYLMLMLGLMLFANTAEAVDCHEPPSCESLGYSKADDPNCLKDGYLNCPFDPTYTICVQHNCATLGFTNTDKTSWCDEIVTCKDDSNYTLCDQLKPEPEPVLCEIGDVYYADGSCGKVDNYVAESSPKPVGVVYYVSEDGLHGKVINLHNLGKTSSSLAFDPEKTYETGCPYLYWGYYNYDVKSLTNYNNPSTMGTQLKDKNADLYDGQGNTDKIIKDKRTSCNRLGAGYYQDCVPEAAQATYDFYPYTDLKNDPLVGEHHWYLPALGELMYLYGYDIDKITAGYGKIGAEGDIKDEVNKTLEALQGKGVQAKKLTDGYYWSSSEFNKEYSWLLRMSDGDRSYWYKSNDNYFVRASLEF